MSNEEVAPKGCIVKDVSPKVVTSDTMYIVEDDAGTFTEPMNKDELNEFLLDNFGLTIKEAK